MHIVREMTFKFSRILARKDTHMLDISEEGDDCWHRGKKLSSTCWCKRNLESPDASFFFYLQLWLYENIVHKAMSSWDFHESGRVLTPTLLLSICKNVDLINQSQQEIVAMLDEINIVGWAPLNWAVEMLISQTFYFISTFLLTCISWNIYF